MSKKEKETVVGIDLGTTYSAPAIYEADGQVRILPNLDGELLTPSVVNLRDEDRPVVGTAALTQIAFAADYTVQLVKRSMGKRDAQGNPITVFVHPDSGRAYTPEEVSAKIIRYLVDSVEATQGVKVVGVVITVPAYFDAVAREATRRAGELAGVKVLSIINEPTAAGLAFGLDHGEDGIFAVFDFGGGTFDISIIEIRNKQFRVLATDGDRGIGGSDIDNQILEKVIAAFKAEYGIDITPETDLVTWLETLGKCETAKKALSQSTTASFMLSAQGQRLVFDLTRSDFDALIAPLIEKTRTITERALAAAKLQPKDITDVLLVGGSTRIVAVRDMVAGLFGKQPRTDTKPDEAVAMGAAIFAARMAGDTGIAVVDTEGQKVLPPPIHMVDVNSHGLGCLAKVNGEELCCVIIPPNTPLPAEMDDVFALDQEGQTAANVIIVQGRHHAKPEECTIIGELVLEGLPPGAHVKRITVKYGLTAEGTLSINADDKISGKSTSDVKHGLGGLVVQVTRS